MILLWASMYLSLPIYLWSSLAYLLSLFAYTNINCALQKLLKQSLEQIKHQSGGEIEGERVKDVAIACSGPVADMA